MKLRIYTLDLAFKKEKEYIEFEDFNYFYGEMGAGKSTIARLVDFCLGGSLTEKDMTPALQSEFVSASLSLKIEESQLNLRRDMGSNLIRAHWTFENEPIEIMIPARIARGEVIDGTGIEVLSDLIYFLAGKTPPKVRKSKIKEESDLARLSFRDLAWYCYLDQDSMDSSFFSLGKDEDFNKRLKSRDVLRFIIGFHQERVSELEVQLEYHRNEKLKCEAGARAIENALNESEIASESELIRIKKKIQKKLTEVEHRITTLRRETAHLKPHAMENLQDSARELSFEISMLEKASFEIREAIANDKAHKNELLSLSTRFRRSQSAREILNGVEFVDCPRCCTELPVREENICPVCGQAHSDNPAGVLDDAAAEKDLDSRVNELNEIIQKYEGEHRKNERILRETKIKKESVDMDLNQVAADYDSSYLALALESEKNRASLRQQLVDLNRIETLVQKINDLTQKAEELTIQEQKLRSELKEAREMAEKDTENLGRLKELFLDCLLKSKLSGFYEDDDVSMTSPNFLPEIRSAESGDLAVTSFNNLGSGGKKTLFKCCFAIAVHRLAIELNALLPTFLIIDSPMKNISERENRAQFEGFFEMLYKLSSTELKNVQIIVIDKELCSPPDDYKFHFKERHMKPNERGSDPKNNPFPPLITYYQA